MKKYLIILLLSISSLSYGQNVKYSPAGGFMPNGNNYVVDSTSYVRGLPDSLKVLRDSITSAIRKDSIARVAIYTPFYDVRSFGAVADSVNDQSVKIKAALDYAGSHGGGTVYIPAGKFFCSFALKVPSYVHLKGAGKGITTIVNPNNTYLACVYTDGATHVTISDFTIDHYKYAPAANGVDLLPLGYAAGGAFVGVQPTTYATVENIEILGNGQHTYLIWNLRAEHTRILNNDIDGKVVGRPGSNLGEDAIEIAGGKDVLVQGNHIKDVGGTGIWTFYHDVKDGVIITDNTIYGAWNGLGSINNVINSYRTVYHNNIIKNIYGQGIVITGSGGFVSSLVVSNNIIDSCYENGIWISGLYNSRAILVDNNTITNTTKTGNTAIVITETSNATVSNNIISKADQGIFINSATFGSLSLSKNITVSRNMIDSTQMESIYCYSPTSIEIIGNTCRNYNLSQSGYYGINFHIGDKLSLYNNVFQYGGIVETGAILVALGSTNIKAGGNILKYNPTISLPFNILGLPAGDTWTENQTYQKDRIADVGSINEKIFVPESSNLGLYSWDNLAYYSNVSSPLGEVVITLPEGAVNSAFLMKVKGTVANGIIDAELSSVNGPTFFTSGINKLVGAQIIKSITPATTPKTGNVLNHYIFSPTTSTTTWTAAKIIVKEVVSSNFKANDNSAWKNVRVRLIQRARVATTTTLPTYTATDSITLTMSAAGIITIDGVNTVINDTILVNSETDSSKDGLYYVSTEGTVSVAAVLKRVAYADTWAELLESGALITAGTTNIGKRYINYNVAGGTLGTTAVNMFVMTTGTQTTQAISSASSYWQSGTNINDVSALVTGNVGIGTLSPISGLEIYKTDAAAIFGSSLGALTVRNTEATNATGSRGYAGVNIAGVNTTTTGIYGGMYGVVTGSSGSGQIGDMMFGTKALPATTSLTQALRINSAQQVLIGTGTSTTNVKLEVVSTTMSSIPAPKMTAANKNAITTPAIGSIVYQTDSTGGFYVRTSTGLWKKLVEERVTAPTVTLGANITGSVSLSTGSTDTKGTVTVTVTGISTLATLNELFTLTFSSAYASTPTVGYWNASPQAPDIEFGATGLYVKNAGTTSFQIATRGSYTTPASATYSFNYQIQ